MYDPVLLELDLGIKVPQIYGSALNTHLSSKCETTPQSTSAWRVGSRQMQFFAQCLYGGHATANAKAWSVSTIK